jgi:23S rRNA pseudouridine955/2504/2580 synthase
MSNHPKNSQPPSVRYVTVGEEHHGQRLDNFLIRELKGAPKTLIYKLLRKGEVRVNKGRVKPDTRVSTGDVVRLPPLRLAERGEAAPLGNSLKTLLENSIVYEDEGLIVINKPAGLAVHGGSGQSLGLIEALRQARPEAKSLELVHRLDRETSGCLLVAKKRSALRFLQDALRKHEVSKTYLALVKGRWPKRKRVVESKLEKFELASGERRVKTSGEGKESRTEFTVLDYYEAGDASCTLLEAVPVTGRTHQIRVHAQSIGCPLACDDKYTDDEFNAVMKKQGFKRLFLHAAQLSFPLPPTEKNPDSIIKTVKADLPDDLAAPLKKLKKCS